jgi:hypothetical protein
VNSDKCSSNLKNKKEKRIRIANTLLCPMWTWERRVCRRCCSSRRRDVEAEEELDVRAVQVARVEVSEPNEINQIEQHHSRRAPVRQHSALSTRSDAEFPICPAPQEAVPAGSAPPSSSRRSISLEMSRRRWVDMPHRRWIEMPYRPTPSCSSLSCRGRIEELLLSPDQTPHRPPMLALPLGGTSRPGSRVL